MRHASVQAHRLGLEAIGNGVLDLGGSQYRAVLEVSGAARPFEDETRTEALLAGFAMFLNGINYPIQILVRASPVDLSQYVAAVEERARHMRGEQLADLAHDHAAFVQGLARQRILLERRFYVVVPSESPAPSRWAFRVPGFRRTADGEPRREAAERQLVFRSEEVIRQLARCGLAVRRLGDVELAQLVLACWSPERARAQRFRQQLTEYTTLAVRGGEAGAPTAAAAD